MISYFTFFPHLLIFYFFIYLFIYLFFQFRDPSCVLNLSTKAVQLEWYIQCKRAKYLQFELIFHLAEINLAECF